FKNIFLFLLCFSIFPSLNYSQNELSFLCLSSSVGAEYLSEGNIEKQSKKRNIFLKLIFSRFSMFDFVFLI
ncbi:MAG: hypothetical protein AAFO07_26050, partial [Bacteroidota bacterium]